jgi:AcrR family transcriptional regulator
MSPRTAEQFREIREGSREKILRAALAVFARHGFEQASVRMIAAEAGVSPGLMYNYFGGKDELLRAIHERGMRDVQESFALGDAAGGPRERLERLIRSSFEIVRGNVEFWRLSYSLRTQPAASGAISGYVQEGSETIRRRLERYLGEAGVENPDVEARILFALIDGVAQHYVLETERYPLKKVVSALVERYCSPPGGGGRQGRQ